MNYSWAQNGARWLGLAPSAPGTHGKEGGLEPPAPPWPPHTWFSSEGLETQTCVFAKSNWNPYSHPSTPEGTLSVCAHPSTPCWERHQHQDINAGQTHSEEVRTCLLLQAQSQGRLCAVGEGCYVKRRDGWRRFELRPVNDRQGIRMEDLTQGHELHPKPQAVLTGGEPEAQRGMGSISRCTANKMVMMENGFCAGHGSQCCVWIFSFRAYQIKTPIDGGTEAAWDRKAAFPRLQS